MKTTLRSLALLVVLIAGAHSAFAQYPQIPSNVDAEARRLKAESNKRSDEAWARALPIVKEWEAKGKPYIPWAAEPADLPQADIPAFPGAEGGGMYSFGGRGGKVYVVTNLDDSGPGSFREALEAGGPRIVLFNVAGIIRLKDRIVVRAPYVTIDGSTAPGDGVCIAGDTVELETHDVVIRHMRFRRGQMWVGDRNDSIGGNPVGNIMIDHVSASWGLDENMSMYRHMYQPPDGGKELKLPTVNITIQNSIFSECLNTFNHAFGSTIGGINSTFHHNLWACNTGRNPSVGMYGDFTFVNNVLFNWVHRTVDGGDHRSAFNIINNYLKPGPATPKGPISYRLLKPESERSKTVFNHFGVAYVAGNVVEGNERVTKDNWDGGVQPQVTQGADEAAMLRYIRVDIPFQHSPLTVQNAKDAYGAVLANAGATLPRRDPVDTRVVDMVRSGKVTAKWTEASRKQLVGVPYQGGQAATEKKEKEAAENVENGIITNPDQVGGYPEYKGEPIKDLCADGIPLSWKRKYGLDEKDAGLSSKILGCCSYTVIECYLYGLDPKAAQCRGKTDKGKDTRATGFTSVKVD